MDYSIDYTGMGPQSVFNYRWHPGRLCGKTLKGYHWPGHVRRFHHVLWLRKSPRAVPLDEHPGRLDPRFRVTDTGRAVRQENGKGLGRRRRGSL